MWKRRAGDVRVLEEFAKGKVGAAVVEFEELGGGDDRLRLGEECTCIAVVKE